MPEIIRFILVVAALVIIFILSYWIKYRQATVVTVVKSSSHTVSKDPEVIRAEAAIVRQRTTLHLPTAVQPPEDLDD